MACDGAALVGLWFEGQAHFAQGLRPETLSRLQPAPAAPRPAPASAEASRQTSADGLRAQGGWQQAPEPGLQPPVLEETQRWLDSYFSGRIPDFTPPLRLRGTPFRKAVWRILLEIPYGQTITYGEIAARLAAPAAKNRLAEGLGSGSVLARAVGGAVGSNPVSLIVPCHRVIGADGSLTGYAAGLDRKRALLRLEHIPLR
ncbi:MAG: methylated-DNA--[protein]-cysteine S-methyltransferase [Bacteroidales bacterium]|nr:methylated-DNA--[protein]-cysteine S-methyltransferase [Bacteroidales bacterium]